MLIAGNNSGTDPDYLHKKVKIVKKGAHVRWTKAS